MVQEVNLDGLTLEQLERLLVELPHAIQRKKEKLSHEAFEEMRQAAERRGLTLDEVLQTKGAVKASSRTPKNRNVKSGVSAGIAKYRHPTELTVTWSGSGRKPNWILDWIAQGRSVEELAIEKKESQIPPVVETVA